VKKFVTVIAVNLINIGAVRVCGRKLCNSNFCWKKHWIKNYLFPDKSFVRGAELHIHLKKR